MARARQVGARASETRRWPLIVGAVLLIFVVAVVIARWGLARRDAEFLQQCHDAGYDAAKCRFFLTATERMNGAVTAQMMIEATTTTVQHR